MALLGVSVYSSNQFNKDQSIVDQFTLLAANLASIRLVFRQLIFQAQSPSNDELFYEYLQTKLEDTSNLVRGNDDYIKNNEVKFDDELFELINGNNLRIYEANTFGGVDVRNTSFQIGLNQFLAKFSNFSSLKEDDLEKEFVNQTVLELFPQMSKLQKDTFFITENGNGDLRDLTNFIMQKLVSNSVSKGEGWESIVLIISLCCIIVTILTSSVLIPFIFTLENESKNVMLKWIMVSPECKGTILKRIN
mmetsp:Transcript_42697/g.41007  ORF Transcript_42697/g.41007 Transcript_42697/m.41007 type:complete len:249 (-) Transcript_42697:1277-2023(-)